MTFFNRVRKLLNPPPAETVPDVIPPEPKAPKPFGAYRRSDYDQETFLNELPWIHDKSLRTARKLLSESVTGDRIVLVEYQGSVKFAVITDKDVAISEGHVSLRDRVDDHFLIGGSLIFLNNHMRRKRYTLPFGFKSGSVGRLAVNELLAAFDWFDDIIGEDEPGAEACFIACSLSGLDINDRLISVDAFTRKKIAEHKTVTP